jgi:hypothetical protein
LSEEEQLRAGIEDTRRELGDTVEALAEKTDVKARASERVDDIKRRTPEKVRSNPLPLAAVGALAFAYWLGRRRGSRL